MEKSKYKSLNEWRESYPNAYFDAKKNGLLEKLCEDFGWTNKKPAGYWTKERCLEDSLKYKYKTEWFNANGSAYNASCKNGWLDECCAHMIETRIKWTFELCKENALKFKKRNEWQKFVGSGYQFAKRRGWLDKCCAHMIERKWTLERCKKDSAKFKSRGEWCEKSVVYKTAHRNGWLEECCAHMTELIKPRNYWTLELCKEDALKYNNRSEWQEKSGTYIAACRNGWIDECCKHMTKYAKRKI